MENWQNPKIDYVGGDEVTPDIFNSLGENEKYLKDEQDIIKQVKITTEQVQDAVVNITQAEERVNLATTEKVKTTFGKIKKWFSDLRALAFKDKVSDSDIIDINASKVIGLHSVATSGDYTELNNKPTITKEAVGLAKVANERQYSAEYPPPYPVTKVNGYIGDVMIGNADVGLSEVANERQYSEHNTPPYPVTSVQGRRGAVSITKDDVGLDNVDDVRQYSVENPPPYPVTSVNNKTGAVAVSKADVGLSNVANERQYSSSNRPPYPVTSVNGMTGAVKLPPNEVTSSGTYPNMTVGNSQKLGGVSQDQFVRIDSPLLQGTRIKKISLEKSISCTSSSTSNYILTGEISLDDFDSTRDFFYVSAYTGNVNNHWDALIGGVSYVKPRLSGLFVVLNSSCQSIANNMITLNHSEVYYSPIHKRFSVTISPQYRTYYGSSYRAGEQMSASHVIKDIYLVRYK